MGFSAITFDVDGTLYDLGRQKLAMAGELVRAPRVLLGWSIEEIRGERGDLRAKGVARLAARLGRSPAEVGPEVDRVIYGAWPASFGPSTPFPAVRELLVELDRRGLRRAVISDYPAEEKLRRMGLEGWSAVVDGEGLGAYKPWPDAMEETARRLGVAPSEILHVGDREEDRAMAERAGARALVLPRGIREAAWVLEALG